MPSQPLVLATSSDAWDSIKKVQDLLSRIDQEFMDNPAPPIDITRIQSIIEELRTVGLPEQVFATMNVTALELTTALVMATQWPALLEKLADCSARLAVALNEISTLKLMVGQSSEMQKVNGEIVAWMHAYQGQVRHAVQSPGTGTEKVYGGTLCGKADWFHPKGTALRKRARCLELVTKAS